LFHTSFNISNVLIQIWFVKYIEKAVRFIIKKKRREDESFGLKFLQTGMLSTSELSLLQAHKEVTEYGKKSQKMFNQVKKQFVETDIKKRKKIADKIAKNEEAMDEIEAEIANYLTKVSEGELSISGSRKIRTLLKISDNIESLADDAFNLSRALKRKNKQEIEFTPEQIQEIQHMFELIDKAFAITMEALHNEKTDMREILAVETKINETRTSLKKKNEANLNENKYTYKSSVIYIDMITICETLGDHLINVNEALYSQNSELSIAAEHR